MVGKESVSLTRDDTGRTMISELERIRKISYWKYSLRYVDELVANKLNLIIKSEDLPVNGKSIGSSFSKCVRGRR